MGHSSSIALGIALNKTDKRIWCIDGDGAALMHMGAMAVIGANKPSNLIHIVINDEAHESVGGVPTVAGQVNFVDIAKACGYQYAAAVSTYSELDGELQKIKETGQLSFLELKCTKESRSDLGRPTNSPIANKQIFTESLR